MNVETMEEKTTRNARVQTRYDELMAEGRRGHYETMFRVVNEELARERERIVALFPQQYVDYAGYDIAHAIRGTKPCCCFSVGGPCPDCPDAANGTTSPDAR